MSEIINSEYLEPNQLWEVTNETWEGDVHRIGYYQGNMADIALYLADKAGYALRFTPVRVNTPHEPTGNEVEVTFGLFATKSNSTKEQIAEELNKIYGDKVTVKAGTSIRGVIMQAKNPVNIEELKQAKIRRAALDKLSPEERKALGLGD
jgi:hypothetical protein